MSKAVFLAIFLLCSLLLSSCASEQFIALMPTSTKLPTVVPISNDCSKTEKEYKTFSLPESWNTISDSNGMDIRGLFAKDLEQELLKYLNQEGTPYQLQNDLTYTQGIQYVDVREYDLDKDKNKEIVMALEVNKTDFSELFLLIAMCVQNQYQFIVKKDSSADPLMQAPRILLIKDLNQDGFDEVVWSTTWAGSDPFPIIDVVAWDKKINNFVNIFDLKSVPFRDVKITIGDIDNNGIDEIMLYGRYEHFGNKMVTYTYAWDGKSYAKAKEEIEP